MTQGFNGGVPDPMAKAVFDRLNTPPLTAMVHQFHATL